MVDAFSTPVTIPLKLYFLPPLVSKNKLNAASAGSSEVNTSASNSAAASPEVAVY